MKMKTTWKKRTAAVALTAALAAGTALPAYALSFDDVKDTDWSAKAIDYVSDKGLMNGVSEKIFDQKSELNRAMAAQILYNKVGRPEVSDLSSFDDVPRDAWYAKAVAWAKENGVVSGVGNNQFAPLQSISRQDAVVILRNFAQKQAKDMTVNGKYTEYSDSAEIADYAKEAMDWAVSKRIVSGVGDNKLAPHGVITREQFAQIAFSYNVILGDDTIHLQFDRNSDYRIENGAQESWQEKQNGSLKVAGFHWEANGMVDPEDGKIHTTAELYTPLTKNITLIPTKKGERENVTVTRGDVSGSVRVSGSNFTKIMVDENNTVTLRGLNMTYTFYVGEKMEKIESGTISGEISCTVDGKITKSPVAVQQ
ncbi:S-layer homology domain-containing protein [Butyricicoccus sp.]|uniref:S-layer homology domain-containing protein n=1 Tax=Butyricicoccus sp. TaxID=2049021 RepID=UPI003D7E8CBA